MQLFFFFKSHRITYSFFIFPDVPIHQSNTSYQISSSNLVLPQQDLTGSLKSSSSSGSTIRSYKFCSSSSSTIGSLRNSSSESGSCKFSSPDSSSYKLTSSSSESAIDNGSKEFDTNANIKDTIVSTVHRLHIK